MTPQDSSVKLTVLLLLVGFALSSGTLVLAQEQSSQPQAARNEEADNTPIPLGEILPQIEETKIFIRHSQQLADSGFPTEDLETRVLEFQHRYEQLKVRTERRLEGLVPPDLIADLLAAWSSETHAATSSQETPTRWSNTLAELLEDVRSRLRRWEMTREGAVEAGIPDPILAEIAKTVEALTALRKSVQDRWVEVISLQDKYSQLLIGCDQMIGLVEERARETRSRLVSLDSPPLWVILTSDKDHLLQFEQTFLTWLASFSSTFDYLRTYPERLVIQVVIFLILLLMMLAVRRRAREWNGDASLQVTRAVLERPFSQALLITLLSSIPIHLLAPRAFGTVISGLALIPLIRLITVLVKPAVRSVVYLLVVVFLVDQLSQLTPSGGSVNRLLITLSTLLGMGICILFLRQLRLKGTVDNRWIPAIRFMLKVDIGVFTASLILNLLGAALLANLLTTGLLVSAYLALVFPIAIVVIKGCLQVMMRTQALQRLRIIKNHSDLVLQRISLGLTVVCLLLWAWITLEAFWLETPFSNAVRTALNASAKMGTVEISLGFVLSFVFLVWLSFAISKFVRFVLEEDIYTRVKLPRGVPGAVSTITHYLILFLGFLIALGAAGFDLSRFTLLAGAFGVGIGFGLQNVVNNFVSGLILLFERPIQVGDKVQMGELFGEVRHIGIRASIVKTWEGAEVIVPNGNLISEAVVNWTLADQIRRVDVTVGVKYGTDPERVLELLLGVAGNHPKVLSDPAPAALFLGFGDSSLDFSLRTWTQFDNFRVVRSELHVGINRALADAGIVIPFPQRDLHVRPVGPAVEDLISREEGHRPSGKPDSNED